MSESVTYTVAGMSCEHCKHAVTEELTQVDGVAAVDVDLETKLVVVQGDALDDGALRAAIVEADLGRDHFHASYLIRFRLKGDPTLWRWVSLIWASPAIRVRLEALAATSAGQYNLNLGALSRVVVAVPPAGELQAMVDELERQLSSLDELGRVLTAASRRLPSLRDSVLGEAFRGRIS